jgi:hypothetical protein
LKSELRETLYFNKYEYRAKIDLVGSSFTYGRKTYTEYLRRLERLLESSDTSPYWEKRRLESISRINLDAIERWYKWQYNNLPGKITTRLSRDSVSVFGNDLAQLETLSHIDQDHKVVYTKAVVNKISGVKYFVNEPKHKYRLLIKSKMLPQSSTLMADLKGLIDRYSGTSTVIVPSRGLVRWFGQAPSSWRTMFCPQCNIEFDELSTYTLICLLFGNDIGITIKLEKAPKGMLPTN